MMSILSIDIETKSSKDLSKCGVYAYCEDKDFEILLFREVEEDGKTGLGKMKHWHVFHVISRRK